MRKLGRVCGIGRVSAVLQRLGWFDELTEAEKAQIERQGGSASWATDLSAGIIRVAMEHGCVPYGNAKARANAWNLPDPVPVHREPLYTPRTDLIAQYPTLPDRRGFRLPHLGATAWAALAALGRNPYAAAD